MCCPLAAGCVRQPEPHRPAEQEQHAGAGDTHSKAMQCRHCQYAATGRETAAEGQSQLGRQGGKNLDRYKS